MSSVHRPRQHIFNGHKRPIEVITARAYRLASNKFRLNWSTYTQLSKFGNFTYRPIVVIVCDHIDASICSVLTVKCTENSVDRSQSIKRSQPMLSEPTSPRATSSSFKICYHLTSIIGVYGSLLNWLCIQ